MEYNNRWMLSSYVELCLAWTHFPYVLGKTFKQEGVYNSRDDQFGLSIYLIPVSHPIPCLPTPSQKPPPRKKSILQELKKEPALVSPFH